MIVARIGICPIHRVKLETNSTLLLQSNLYQIINEPTRYFSNKPAILDLIITDCPHLILSSGVSPRPLPPPPLLQTWITALSIVS